MAKYRVHKTDNYTVMSNVHFREKDMTLRAKGLLSLMLSLPDDWEYSVDSIVKLSKDGKWSVTAGLHELEEFGYLVRSAVVDQNGKFCGYNYDIYEEPQSRQPSTEKPLTEKPLTEKPSTEKPLTEKPSTEKPLTEKPSTENQPQLKYYKLKYYGLNDSNNKDYSIDNNNINNINNNIYIYIVEFLNKKAGTRYKPSSRATQAHIKARLAEGFTVEDFENVIEKKCAAWKGTEMEQYLRPETLFGTKFESYLNQHIKPENHEKQTEKAKSFDVDDFFSAAFDKSYGGIKNG